MCNIKVQCEVCNGKFFSLNRKIIKCKCGNEIIIKDKEEFITKQESEEAEGFSEDL